MKPISLDLADYADDPGARREAKRQALLSCGFREGIDRTDEQMDAALRLADKIRARHENAPPENPQGTPCE